MIGALVTDGGSLLSHPAITAREHGTPCVVGAVGCCTAIEVRPQGKAGFRDLNQRLSSLEHCLSL